MSFLLLLVGGEEVGVEGGGRGHGVTISLRHELLPLPLSACLHLLKHAPHCLCLALLSGLGDSVRVRV